MVPPGLGAGVPPLWLVVVEIVAWVAVWTVDRGTVVEIDSSGVEVVVSSLLSSPETTIRPTTSPITRARRMPMVQRARVFTVAMLTEGAAENLERLVDLGLTDHQRRQEAQGVCADRVGDQALCQQARGGALRIHVLEAGADH